MVLCAVCASVVKAPRASFVGSQPADAPRIAASRTARGRRPIRPGRGTGSGRLSSRRSAVTAPPRALPSSLVTTMPVGWYRLGEEPPLLDGVLTDGAVEHEQRLVRRAGQAPADHSHHLPELVHEAFLGVQPPRRVHDDRVQPARDRGVDRVERHRRRIAARRARDAGHAEPLGPDLELGDGAGAVGVGRREQTLRPSRWSRRASLAAVVVLPVPLTPTSRMTVGPSAARASSPGMLRAVRAAR